MENFEITIIKHFFDKLSLTFLLIDRKCFIIEIVDFSLLTNLFHRQIVLYLNIPRI